MGNTTINLVLEPDRLIRLPEVMRITSLSRTQIYRMISTGSFSKQSRISHKVAAWRQSDVAAWVASVTAA